MAPPDALSPQGSEEPDVTPAGTPAGNASLGYLEAVSYTHLDVYKRQAQGGTGIAFGA